MLLKSKCQTTILLCAVLCMALTALAQNDVKISSQDAELKSSLAQLLGRFDVSTVETNSEFFASDEEEEDDVETDLCNGEDKQPEGGISCAERKEWGSCGKTWMKKGGYCAVTCGRCSVKTDQQNRSVDNKADDREQVECTDIEVEEEPFGCADRKAWGGCDVDWLIAGGYCIKTCGRCGNTDQDQTVVEAATISQSEDTSTIYSNADSNVISNQSLLAKEAKPQNVSLQKQGVWFGESENEQNQQQNQEQFGVQDGKFKFRVIFFSDFHGRVEPQTEWWKDCDWNQDSNGACFGGIPRMKAVIDAERAKNDMPVLVLNAGDDFVGTAWDWHWRYQGSKGMANFMNKLGIDAMTLGNHEFDRGPDELAQYIDYLNYPVISCNTRAEKHQGLNSRVQGGIVKELGGVKIGIVGFTVESTADYSNPWPVYFTNKYEAGKQCIDQLKREGANIIIALDHIGFGGDKQLAQLMDDVDIVIGGHSHILLHDGTPPKLSLSSGSRDEKAAEFPVWQWSNPQQRNVPVMQCGHFSRYICSIEVEFDSQGNLLDLQGNSILLGGHQSETNIKGDSEVWNEMINWKFW